MPGPRAKTPVWQAIADALRADLAEGRYGPGDRLPTEAALAERFGVNRHTVRHGLSALVEEGLVRTRRGAGAFVAATPTNYPIGKRMRFHEQLIAAGRRPEKRVLHVETRQATDGEARALELTRGDAVCVYHGLSLADGHPIALFESLFPVARLPGIAKAFETKTSVTEALLAAGIRDYARRSTRVTAVRATATQAVPLQVQEGDPLLRTTGVNVDPEGLPVEFGRSWFAGDRITLTLET